MKYLMMMLFAMFFVMNQTIAEQNEDADDNDRPPKPEWRGKENKKRPANHWRILQNISQEERKRLRQLYASDPESFKEEVAKIAKRIREEQQKTNAQIKELLQEYKSTKDEQKKKAALAKLRKITKDSFLAKMQHNKRRLESLEKKVKKLRQQYEFREKNVDKIIQNRVKSLLRDKNLEW